MDRRAFLAIAASTAALPRIAGAQNNPRTVKIGWLTAQQEASLTPYLAAMRQCFSELGYTEGRNLIIDYRFGNDQLDRVPELATELINSGAELIVAQGARGQGIGRNLVARIQAELARRGRRILIADVWHDAEPFYVRWGGSLPMSYYSDGSSAARTAECVRALTD